MFELQQVYNCVFIIPWIFCHIFGSGYNRIIFLMIIVFGCFPIASAQLDHSPFPDITFKIFSDFIQDQFGSQISLATVLTILFSMTSNPDLLTLHARQQYPKAPDEVSQKNSVWIKVLAQELDDRLGAARHTLFRREERSQDLTSDQMKNSIGIKLDVLSKVLHLHPYNGKGQFFGKLKPIWEQDIEPVHVICPISVDCETSTCQSHAILKHTRERDMPRVVLIKGTKIFDDVPVISGQCPKCLTTYFADHEHSRNAENAWMTLHLNSANFLKIGQNIWVDCIFSSTVLNATYSFHASPTAFAEFWNASFWSTQRTTSRKVSRRQIWQAFVKESV